MTLFIQCHTMDLAVRCDRKMYFTYASFISSHASCLVWNDFFGIVILLSIIRSATNWTYMRCLF